MSYHLLICRTILCLPHSLFIINEFNPLKKLSIDFSIYWVSDIGFLLIFFCTLISCHNDQVLAAWLILKVKTLIFSIEIGWRHEVSLVLLTLLEARMLFLGLRFNVRLVIEYSLHSLILEPFTHKVLKLVHRYMTKRSILTLG
jgi:hypothetical protein